ncbi:hypothetical protein ACIA6D_37020 [Streptomyces cacaoi]
MASTDLGHDSVPPRALLRDTMAGGTSELLDRLLSEPGNRSVRLLAALGVDPADLLGRAGLRPAERKAVRDGGRARAACGRQPDASGRDTRRPGEHTRWIVLWVSGR